jgi:NADH/NAD ratio-sensing transcriptional regulator Rex
MEFDQKEETPFNIPEKKKADKKTLAIYIGAGVITISSLIYGYASYQATYFKDLEIKNLKTQLEDANIKLQRIDALENQVKELEASLAKKVTVKPEPKKVTKTLPKKEIKKPKAISKAKVTSKKVKSSTKEKEVKKKHTSQ